jgi:hypothetical protein
VSDLVVIRVKLDIMKTLFPFTQAGFILVTVVYVGLFLQLFRKGLLKTNFSHEKKNRIFYGLLGAIVLWLIIISLLAGIQFFNDFSTLPPKFFLVVIIPLILILYFAFRDETKEILLNISAQNIVYLQTFRVFVEILLWMLFIDNLLPFQMTFEGYNFDIVAGLTAPFAGYFAARRQSPFWLKFWNFCCLGLLINIVTIAVISTPVPFRVFMNEPANTIVTQFPIVWLPGLLVPLAYTLHILSLRQASTMQEGRVVPT